MSTGYPCCLGRSPSETLRARLSAVAETHSRPIPGGTAHWLTERLWELSRDLPIDEVAIDAIAEFDMDCWFDGEPATCRAVAEHTRRINNADLSVPVILSADGLLMDGRSRVGAIAVCGAEPAESLRVILSGWQAKRQEVVRSRPIGSSSVTGTI